MNIYDISPKLHPGIAVWPGDTPFSREDVMRIGEGDNINLSSITLSLHCGAHLDAPRHFQERGGGVDQVPLEACVGPATVVQLTASGTIGPRDLEPVLAARPQRLLVGCHPRRDPDTFSSEFTAFSTESAQLLAASGVRLVGTDAPSVDRFDSRDLPVHQVFGAAGIVILENLLLGGVPAGEYELIALPLNIAGADGAPVRAILRGLT